MTKEAQANTLVMVNLDSLIAGDNAYVYSGDGEGRNIRDWLLDWAENEEVPLQIQTGDWSDHAPFKHVGIPFRNRD